VARDVVEGDMDTTAELPENMCIDAVFGEPGQSRSLLYAPLAKAMVTEEYHQQIMSSIGDMSYNREK
jgi:hypothetical protein